MRMIGHKDEFMHFETLLPSILASYIQQKLAKTIWLQKEDALKRGERHEERADFLRSPVPGLKASS